MDRKSLLAVVCIAFASASLAVAESPPGISILAPMGTVAPESQTSERKPIADSLDLSDELELLEHLIVDGEKLSSEEKKTLLSLRIKIERMQTFVRARPLSAPTPVIVRGQMPATGSGQRRETMSHPLHERDSTAFGRQTLTPSKPDIQREDAKEPNLFGD